MQAIEANVLVSSKLLQVSLIENLILLFYIMSSRLNIFY